MRAGERFLCRGTMATLAGAVATAGLLAFAGPASASVTFMTCDPGHFSGFGSETFNPPLSHTNSNTTPSTINVSGAATTCVGKVTGGTISATMTSRDPSTGQPGPANCSGFWSPPPPAGAVEAKGTFTATWTNGKNSSGSARLKSNGLTSGPTVYLVLKVTSGYGFLAGHVTKIKSNLNQRNPDGDCVTRNISRVDIDNPAPLTFVQN